MTSSSSPSSQDAAAGAAVYNQPVLSVYDWFVLGFSNSYAWQCPSPLILEFYNQHITNRHLDVGVGTGYFLDKCRFPAPNPAITLFDLNANSLVTTARRLQRYRPTTQAGNVLEPLPFAPQSFDSVALNYLLHCLPGDMTSKAVVFQHLKPVLNPQTGVVFGTTILGQGQRPNAIARWLMSVYNRRGIFGNARDSAETLDTALRTHFRTHTLRIVGCVAFFVGRV